MSENRSSSTTLEIVLAGLMRRYRQRVPDVQVVTDCLVRDGVIPSADDIENDHIAFRTIGVPALGIPSLEKVFLRCGYRRRDAYFFAAKKLNAFWYSPPQPKYPRIFVSALRVGDLSLEGQAIIHSYTADVHSDPVDKLELDDGFAVDNFLHQPLWRTPTWSDYQRLAAESEYAAWAIYNRYYLNHFTVSIHDFPEGFNTIEEFNGYVERNGLKLNDAGGKVKTSADGLLIQSSTVAQMVLAEFDNGHRGIEQQRIPGSYVEFAQRRILPQFQHLPPGSIRGEHRRDGFETANADKIFESTYSHQTGQRSTSMDD